MRVAPARMRVGRGLSGGASLTVALAMLIAPFFAVCSQAAGPPVDRRTLSNGAVLLISEQHTVPMVVVQLLIDAGSRRDPSGQEGLADLSAELLTEGTRTRSATQISDAVDRIGAALSSSAETDYATVALTVLRKDLDTGLQLLTDVLLHPSFPEAEVTRRREAVLADLRASQDNPGHVAQRLFTQAAFAGEPYGHLVNGMEESVRRLRRADVVAFYGRFYHPEHSIITVVGDVSVNDIAQRLEDALGDWKRGAVAPFVYAAPASAAAAVVTRVKPISQANLILGQRGLARDNPDYYAVTVMNFILGGGGFTSRLLENIRTKAGLAYSIGSGFSVNQSPGSFQIVMQTKNSSAHDAIDKACEEVARIRRELVSEDELTGAKLYLTGSFPMRFDSNFKIAGFLAQVEFFGLGSDYADSYPQRINAVTRADVLRVAQQYLHPEQMWLVAVADLEQANIPAAPPCQP